MGDAVRILLAEASFSTSALTCTASSRVGARISACGPASLRGQLFEERQHEGGRLAGAGLGLADDVVVVERERKQAGLDGRRLGVAGLLTHRIISAERSRSLKPTLTNLPLFAGIDRFGS